MEKRNVHHHIILLLWLQLVQAYDQPPQITTTFQDTYYLPEDNDVPATWQCRASGDPPPKYEWNLNGNTIKSSQYVTVINKSGKLIIKRAQISDFGDYRCIARNRVGIAISSLFKLRRSFIGLFSDTGNKIIIPAVTEFSHISMKCEGKPKCIPQNQCKIEWKRGEGVKDSIKETKRVALDKYGTLHLLFATMEDSSTAVKPYSCVIGNENLKTFYKGPDIIFPMIKQAQTPNRKKPNLVFKHDAFGLLGGDAELQCVFASYPLPDVSWTEPNGRLIQERSEKYEFRENSFRRTLKVNNLSIEDEGEYTCIGTNENGIAEAKVYLNVTSKPFFRRGKVLESLVLPVNKNARFSCKMYSVKGENPPSSPEWFKNGVPIPQYQIGPERNKKYELNANGSVLTIKDIKKPEDTCTITCKAGNVIHYLDGGDLYSEKYADATLRVIDPILVSLLSNTTQKRTSTEPFSFAFIATTDESVPQLYYNWEYIRPDNKTVYDDEILQKLPFVSFNSDRTNMTIIPDLVDEDIKENQIHAVLGLYRVVIYHEFDSVTKSFNVFTTAVVPDYTVGRYFLVILGILAFIGIVVVAIILYHARQKKNNNNKSMNTDESALRIERLFDSIEPDVSAVPYRINMIEGHESPPRSYENVNPVRPTIEHGNDANVDNSLINHCSTRITKSSFVDHTTELDKNEGSEASDDELNVYEYVALPRNGYESPYNVPDPKRATGHVYK